jgi:predicted GIY-YIG superfamily endonuclease
MVTDLWREPDHFERLQDLDDQERNIYHGTSKDDPNRNLYPGKVYAVYDIRTGNNRFYIGSTDIAWEKRLQYHYETAVGNKFEDSLFYRWMQERLKGINSFEEAKQHIKLTVVCQIWFSKYERRTEKTHILQEYEKQMINKLYCRKRMLNTNLIDKRSRTEATRRMIKEALECDDLEKTRQFLRDWDASLRGSDGDR